MAKAAEVAHTPTPWCVPAGGGNDGVICAGDDPSKPGDILFVLRAPMGRSRIASDGDISANAAFIVKAVNSHDALVTALEEIAEGRGTFSRDPLTHASNTIDEMKAIAREALAQKGLSQAA